MVLGFVKDKEIEEIFRMLPKHAAYYFCAPKINRAEDISTLVHLAEKNNLRSKTFESVAIACKSAAKNAGKSDLIYIGEVLLLFLKFFKKSLCKQRKLFYICTPQGRLAQLVQSTWFTPKGSGVRIP